MFELCFARCCYYHYFISLYIHWLTFPFNSNIQFSLYLLPTYPKNQTFTKNKILTIIYHTTILSKAMGTHSPFTHVMVAMQKIPSQASTHTPLRHFLGHWNLINAQLVINGSHFPLIHGLEINLRIKIKILNYSNGY